MVIFYDCAIIIFKDFMYFMRFWNDSSFIVMRVFDGLQKGKVFIKLIIYAKL